MLDKQVWSGLVWQQKEEQYQYQVGHKVISANAAANFILYAQSFCVKSESQYTNLPMKKEKQDTHRAV